MYVCIFEKVTIKFFFVCMYLTFPKKNGFFEKKNFGPEKKSARKKKNFFEKKKIWKKKNLKKKNFWFFEKKFFGPEKKFGPKKNRPEIFFGPIPNPYSMIRRPIFFSDPCISQAGSLLVIIHMCENVSPSVCLSVSPT